MWAAVIALLLLVPLLARAPWSLFDYAVAGALLFATGLAFELVAKKGVTIEYRAAVGVACATALVLVWINLAVGLIGSEDNPANLMYAGVLAVGFVGALIARLQPRGMARALFTTTIAQMLVPTIAIVIWKDGWQDLLIDPNSPHPPFHAGIVPIFLLNAIFAMLWVVSGLLFRRAGKPQSKIPGEELGRGATPGVAP